MGLAAVILFSWLAALVMVIGALTARDVWWWVENRRWCRDQGRLAGRVGAFARTADEIAGLPETAERRRFV